MRKIYRFRLTEDERSELQKILGRSKSSAKKQCRARILLLADEASAGARRTDQEIAEAVSCSRRTVENTRRDMVEGGLDSALERAKSSRVYRRKLDGEQEAKLIALCCGSPPPGRARWTLHLLADKLVELQIVDTVSHESVRKVLNDNEIKPWKKKQWCIPPLAKRHLRQRDGRCSGSVSSAMGSKTAVGVPR